MPNNSQNWKKDCGKPGCRNDHGSQVLAHDEVIEWVRLPLMDRYCCKSRKSNDPKNLEKVDF
jgi:hypothetical protein